jgi:hypothetical protein
MVGLIPIIALPTLERWEMLPVLWADRRRLVRGLPAVFPGPLAPSFGRVARETFPIPCQRSLCRRPIDSVKVPCASSMDENRTSEIGNKKT